MKKFVFLFLVILPIMAFAQKAKIEFETPSHNFGTISETGGPAVYEFIFKNTGDAPLILTQVRAGCGCTTPEWGQSPIAPNQSSKIKVSFDPRNRPGQFIKTISVNSNGDPAVVSLTIRGNVTSKPVDPYAAYTYAVGALKINSNSINFGNINNNQSLEKVAEIINSGDTPLTITAIPDAKNLTVTVTPTTLNKGEKGKIVIKFNANLKNDWGFISDKVEISTSAGAKGSLAIAANISEDFSIYKQNNYENAPVANFSENDGNLGVLTKNSNHKHEFYIQNDGKSDLIIRKIKTSDNTVTANAAKNIIKPGKKVKVTVNLKTDDQPGKRIKIVAFTLNDPKNTIISYKLTGNIQ